MRVELSAMTGTEPVHPQSIPTTIKYYVPVISQWGVPSAVLAHRS